MAVDLVSFQKTDERLANNEAANSAGLKNIEEQLLGIFKSQSQFNCNNLTDFTLSNFKQVVNRTGHARFRRGPSDPSTSSSLSQPTNSVQVKTNPILSKPKARIASEECKSINTPMSSGSSSITGDEGSVSNGKQGLSAVVTPAPLAFSSRKPPLPSSHWKRCRDLDASHGISVKQSISRGCHCCKRRKMVVKSEISRVTTTKGSSKVADIPADEYSWKKYDQKLIPGALSPRRRRRRGYYKCNSVKGCTARKHVERAHNDPTVLIVTYEGEHRHSHPSTPFRL